jgi:DNA-binding transcriptional ArsR family regulator
VITAYLDAASMGKVRLAVSPATEAVTWLRMTAFGRRHPVFGDPGAAARFALRDPDVALLATVLSANDRYMPDLLTPKPGAGPANRVWERQLEMTRDTSPETVVAQLELCPEVLSGDAGAFARRAANGLNVFWRQAIADSWSGLHERLRADLTVRAGTMAAHGIGALLDTLSPKVSWTGSGVNVYNVADFQVHLADAELVLAPTVLAWPEVWSQLTDPADAAISYPALGVGSNASPAGDGTLGRLVGSTRATLLRDLNVPRSTTELSVRHQLAPATVSYHLRVLHGSGLVTRSRDRRTVLYQRTERGAALDG